MNPQSDPAFRVALGQAVASIRVRFGRHAVTSVGIALGIAFFASINLMRSVEIQDPGARSRLLWLVSTSLLMCLVGVTNSMLMSVTERYREIGTIKCLGASDGFIVKVFFLEAFMIGFIGSVIGSIVGALLMWIVLSFGDSHPTVAGVAATIGLSTGLGIALTVLSAIFPAIQAARMPAAAALRVEV